ncbi:MAG TPA: hypothetical protein VLH79_03045 [Chthonomonadales bacterium]|nr:hypothetical protein [Chthonomonadales bacterium]
MSPKRAVALLALLGAVAVASVPATASAAGAPLSLGAGSYAGLAGQGLLEPLVHISLRGGAMLSPRGAGVVGIDASLPVLSIGPGWRGRLDADVIIRANLAGVNTMVPLTINQLYTVAAPGRIGVGYYGAGVGIAAGGGTRLTAKLVAGAEIARRLGGEVNVHFVERDTLVTVVARLHL